MIRGVLYAVYLRINRQEMMNVNRTIIAHCVEIAHLRIYR